MKKLNIKILILMITLIICSGCNKSLKQAHVENPAVSGPNKITLTLQQEQNIGIKTDTVQYRSIDETARIQAHVQAIDERVNHIFSPVDG